MRQIGTIDDDSKAEAFRDYLLAQGMPNMVEEETSTGKWSVWVENDDHLDRAKVELAGFTQSPDDPRYRKAGKAADGIRKQEEKKQERLKKQFVNVRTRWSQPQQWKVPLTLTLILGSVVVAMGTNFDENKGSADLVAFCRWDTLAQDFHHLKPDEMPFVDNDQTNDPPPTIANIIRKRILLGRLGLGDLKRGQIWRVITPIFLHMGLLHLVFNMFWMRDLGGMIERQRGTLKFAALVVAASILSNVAQNFWDGPKFGGMSGVNYALFGYAWMRGRFDSQGGVGVTQMTIGVMLVWLVLCMVGAIERVANAAHVAGLIVGVIAGYAPFAWRHVRRITAPPR